MSRRRAARFTHHEDIGARRRDWADDHERRPRPPARHRPQGRDARGRDHRRLAVWAADCAEHVPVDTGRSRMDQLEYLGASVRECQRGRLPD